MSYAERRSEMIKQLVWCGGLLLLAQSVHATEYTPTTGEELQTNLSAAVAGDVITLNPTLTYSRSSPTNGYSIPSCPATPITLRSSAHASITTPTAAMTRAEWDAWIATNSAHFAKIVTGGGPTFDIRGGACNWTITGI